MGFVKDLLKKRNDKYERIVPQVQRGRNFSTSNGVVSKDDGSSHTPDGIKIPIWQRLPVIRNIIGTSNKNLGVKDDGKRQRIFFLSAIIVCGVVILKYLRSENWGITDSVVVAVLAGVIAYVGQIWAFRFNVYPKSYYTTLIQPSLFAFSTIFFVVLMFFQQFQRIYEVLFFSLFLLVLVIIFVVVFLTSNILNVSISKQIPLLQAAQTSSYIILLCTVFFVIYSFVSIGLPFYMLFPISFIFVFAAVLIHLSSFNLSVKNLIWYSIVISWACCVLLVVLLVWPIETLIFPLLPTTIVYIGVGIVMHNLRKLSHPALYFEYAVLIALGVLVVLFSSSWGIGGYLWG
ncbi:hypothetical protein JW887_04475 [Candidatus Dojkabacteria bacterium]|nr:hypothetical protein [Candidatus Dojkabacteria bacterium]